MAAKAHRLDIHNHVETPTPSECVRACPSSLSREARRVKRVTILKSSLGSFLRQGPGRRPPPADKAAFLCGPPESPWGGDLRRKLVWSRAIPSNPSWKPRNSAWLGATGHSVPSFIGVLYPRSPPSLNLRSEHLEWNH